MAAATPSTKNFRHGRIKVESGDATPLVKYLDFTEGDFTSGEDFPSNEVRSRGYLREMTRGDEQLVSWSFSAKFRDKTLERTLRDKVWDGTVSASSGLTGGAVNSNVVTAYAYEQGSLSITTAGTWNKLAIGATPVADGDYSEVAGAADVEGVIRCTKFNVKMPAATTSVATLYDAVGAGTLGTGVCQGGVKTFDLTLEVFDPCDPPDYADNTKGTIVEKRKIANAFLEKLAFKEASAADMVTMSGRALTPKVELITV